MALLPGTTRTLGSVYAGGGLPELTEEEQASKLRQVMGAGGSVIGGIGSLLDTYSGASTVRDLLGGEGLQSFDQLLDPFDESKRITGRELGRRTGLIGNDEDTWGNFAGGLAGEILLDPLTYASFGASALGKLGKSGQSLMKPDLLKRLGKGKATLRAAGSGDDFLKLASYADEVPTPTGRSALAELDEAAADMMGLPDYLHKPATSKSGMKSGEAFEQLRALEKDRVGSNARWAGIEVGKGGAVSRQVAGFTDKVADGIKNSPIGKATQKVFNPAIRGITSELGMQMARLSRDADTRMIAGMRATTRKLLKQRKDLGFEGKGDEWRQMLESIHDVYDDTKNAIDVNEFIPDNLRPKAKQHIDTVRGLFQDLIDQGHAIGNDVAEFTSEGLLNAGYFAQHYFPRANEVAKLGRTSSGRRFLFSTADGHNMRRVSALRDNPEGTRIWKQMFDESSPGSKEIDDVLEEIRLAKEAAGDPSRSKLRTKGRDQTGLTKGGIQVVRAGGEAITEGTPAARIEAGIEKFSKLMEKHYGPNTLPAQWRTRPLLPGEEALQTARPRERIIRNYNYEDGGSGKVLKGDRYRDLAELLSDYTSDQRAAGLFSNDPLIDLENRLIRGWESQNVGKVGLRLMAKNSTERFGHGEKGISLRRVLNKGKNKENSLGLREGDEHAGALKEIYEHLRETDDIPKFATVDEIPREAIDIPNSIIDETLEMSDEAAAAHLTKYVDDQVATKVRQVNDTILDQIRDRHVPTELADSLARVRQAHTPDKHGSEFWQRVDSYTSWFKSMNTVANSVFPLSAFATRNFYAGQYGNYAAGVWSPKAFKNSMDFWAGNTVKGAAAWKSVRREVMERARDEAVPQAVQDAGEVAVKNFQDAKIEKALKGLTDETATDILEDIVYTHNVLGPNLGNIDTGVLRPDRLDTSTPQRFPTRERLPGKGLPGQVAGFTKETYGKVLRPGRRGLTFNPTDVAGTGQAQTFAEKFHTFRKGPAQQETRFGLVKAGEGINGMVESMNRGTAFFHQLENGIDPAQAALKTNALQVDYSWRNYTDIERDYLTRAFPFYKWTRAMIPFTLKQLMEKPGGKIAQTIRGQNRLAGNDEGRLVPDRLRQGLSVPLGEDYWLQKIDLPHEGAFQAFGLGDGVGDTIGRSLRGLGGSAHPIPKAAVEWATGKRMFDGRDLERLDGGMARIYSNVGDIIASVTGKELPEAPLPKKGSGFENVIWSMIGGPLTKVRNLTDVRELKKGAPGVGKIAVNLATGARITNVPPSVARYEAQDKLRDQLNKSPDVRESITPYVRKEDMENLSERDRVYLELWKRLKRRPKEGEVDQLLKQLGLQ